VHQLAEIIATQIPSIGHVYEKLPDRAPVDNEVLLPMTKAKIIDDTNGKLKVRFSITAQHLFRRTEMDSALTRAYTYVMPWLLMLSAWTNQTLGGLSIAIYMSDLGLSQVVQSGQVYVALICTFDVLTEFNIVLN
jgi:hypothetical protein